MRNACSIWPMHECTNDTAKTHYLNIKDGQKQWHCNTQRCKKNYFMVLLSKIGGELIMVDISDILKVLRVQCCLIYAVLCIVKQQTVFFSGPLGGEISPPKFLISPPNTNKFKLPAGCFSNFLLSLKQFPP